MSAVDIRSKAQKQAHKHYERLIKDCDFLDIVEHYAKLSNNQKAAIEEFERREERGGNVDAVYADMCYYGEYQDLIANYLAGYVLASEGYEKDRWGHYILKSM